MDGVIFVEVLGRGGLLKQRARVATGTISVGRAYDNDVIVEDPFVDPHALRITVEEDGRFLVEDLGSVNGVTGPTGPVVAPTRVSPGDTLRVGRTRLRLVTPGTPVPPALTEVRDPVLQRVTSARGLAAGAVGSALSWGVYSFVAEYGAFKATDLGGEVLLIGALLAMWAGVWAMATRLAVGRAFFLRHFAIGCAVFAVSMPVTGAVGLLPFLWPGTTTDLVAAAVFALLFAFALHLHLGVSSRLGLRARAVWAGVVVAALTGLGGIATAVDDAPGSAVVGALGSLWPLPDRWIPSRTLDGFMAGLDQLDEELADRVDRERRSPSPADGGAS